METAHCDDMTEKGVTEEVHCSVSFPRVHQRLPNREERTRARTRPGPRRPPACPERSGFAREPVEVLHHHRDLRVGRGRVHGGQQPAIEDTGRQEATGRFNRIYSGSWQGLAEGDRQRELWVNLPKV